MYQCLQVSDTELVSQARTSLHYFLRFQLMDKVMRALGQAKSSLIVPQKPSIPDLMAFNSQVT